MGSLAIIPARGGSKGLRRKNVLPMAGRPMLAHSVAAALESGLFDEVVVSSEDDEILAAARAAGATAIVRPDALSTDTASSADVVLHALEQHRWADTFALLQPTSPLRTAAHLREAAALLTAETIAVVSICECAHHPLKTLLQVDGHFVPTREWRDLTQPRQSLPRAVQPNGAIYFGRSRSFVESKDFLPAGTVWYEMSQTASIDVDDATSFGEAERALLSGL
ncbi:MAG: acylneuraminate cytidylyltransferase family protein [Sandaracinaceae bacterium]|nr:acylneuraminate cytidylyltransferase family protein [Sandaracinaceae bacterium]